MKPELFEVAEDRCRGEGHGGYAGFIVYAGGRAHAYQHDAAFFNIDEKRIREVLLAWAAEEEGVVTYEIEYYDGCRAYEKFQPRDDEEVAQLAERRFARKR
jgi:hypothetical protein